MTEKLKEKTKELLETKPKEVQEVVNSIDWGKISEEIGKKYFLNDSEINDLQVETIMALVGMTDLTFLSSNIEENVGTVGKEEAKKISTELLEKIFTPVFNQTIEKIKTNIKDKKTSWQQNISFILSGGDYFVFLGNTNTRNLINEIPKTEKVPVNYSKIEDLKNKFTI